MSKLDVKNLPMMISHTVHMVSDADVNQLILEMRYRQIQYIF